MTKRTFQHYPIAWNQTISTPIMVMFSH